MKTSHLFVPGALFVSASLVELWVRVARVPAFVFPAPSAVLRELASAPGLFAGHAATTLGEAGGGLLIAAAMAFAFAVCALTSPTLDRLLTPLVVVSQTVPVIAVAPLLVLWFGYGTLPRLLICALIAFFPMSVTALEGLRAADPRLLLLFRSAGATSWDVFWRVRVPGAAPYLAAGFRTGLTLSLVGAIVAEWTGTDRGLGYLVLSANSRLATAQAFAAVLVVSTLGVASYAGVKGLEKRFGWWNRETLHHCDN